MKEAEADMETVKSVVVTFDSRKSLKEMKKNETVKKARETFQ